MDLVRRCSDGVRPPRPLLPCCNNAATLRWWSCCLLAAACQLTIRNVVRPVAYDMHLCEPAVLEPKYPAAQSPVWHPACECIQKLNC
jgi:hypothetical protein